MTEQRALYGASWFPDFFVIREVKEEKHMALESTLPLLFVVIVAFSLKKAKILRKEDSRVLSKLVMWLVAPATVIHSLLTTTIQPELLLLSLAAVIVVAMLLAIGFLLAPVLGLQGTTRAAYLLGYPTLSLGSIGFPFMLAAFGPRGLALLVFFDLGHAFCLFVGIPLLASALAKGAEHFHPRDALLHILHSPIIWSYAMSILANLLHIHNMLLSNLLTTFSQSFVLLAMVIVGIEIELRRGAILLPLVSTYLKLCTGVLVGIIVSHLFGFVGLERIAVVLGTSLPTSLFTVMYAKEYELDASFLASMISLALPTSLLFCSLFLLIFH